MRILGGGVTRNLPYYCTPWTFTSRRLIASQTEGVVVLCDARSGPVRWAAPGASRPPRGTSAALVPPARSDAAGGLCFTPLGVQNRAQEHGRTSSC